MSWYATDASTTPRNAPTIYDSSTNGYTYADAREIHKSKPEQAVGARLKRSAWSR